MKKLSILVPCYNEQDALPIFYKEISRVLSSLDYDYEIIFVDDGSKDDTLNIIKDISSQNQNVFYLSFSRNFGKEAAMYAGFRNSTGDYVAVMDADMQDPPSLLPKMIEIIENDNYDSVATRRVTRKGEPPIRSWFARKFYAIINKISDADIVDGARDFRLMKRSMVDVIISMTEYDRFSKGIFGWIGFKTYWLPFENVERVAGQTKWSFWKLFKYAINGIVDFSLAPVHISSWIGFLLILLSLITLIINNCLYAFFDEKYMFLVFLICIIGGMQFVFNGIMGQYIAKTYREVKNRPPYIVMESNKEIIK